MDKLRELDNYGAPVSLKYRGKQSYQTVGGAVATLLLRMTIGLYFCKQLLQVMDYGDPEISSYEVMDDRNNMEKALVLNDMKTDFIVGFMN